MAAPNLDWVRELISADPDSPYREGKVALGIILWTLSWLMLAPAVPGLTYRSLLVMGGWSLINWLLLGATIRSLFRPPSRGGNRPVPPGWFTLLILVAKLSALLSLIPIFWWLRGEWMGLVVGLGAVPAVLLGLAVSQLIGGNRRQSADLGR